MVTNWPTTKFTKKSNWKNGDIYYLMKDILFCFPDTVENNLVGALNQHLIAKTTIQQIFKNEVREKKPQFRILAGALILQNNFLRSLPSSAFYETMDIVPEIKYCFSDSKTITLRRLSAQTILRLFISLYLEYCIIQTQNKIGLKYRNKFKKYFSKEDMKIIINTDGFLPKLIMRSYGIELGVGEEINSKIDSILDNFYS
jgi:hypothetical protein